MKTIITTQQFRVEYEVPDEEVMRFEGLLDLGSDELASYEVNQDFLGETIVYVTD
jgi:hypothetical protein